MASFKKIRNVIFLGKKPWASKALEFLVQNGIHVRLVVTPKHELYRVTLGKTAKKYKIPVLFGDENFYQHIATHDFYSNIDLVISFLFWQKIKMPLIRLGKLGCVNFHPAPLPDYKGRAGYNTAILEQRKEYGVSAHYVDSEKFDAGPIIRVSRFPIDSERENAYSLEQKTQEKLYDLFVETMLLLEGKTVTTTPNIGGLYLNLEQLEKLKEVDLKKDTPEEINRKIRAFFFPPYSGAKIFVNGEELTLVNAEILKYISERF